MSKSPLSVLIVTLLCGRFTYVAQAQQEGLSNPNSQQPAAGAQPVADAQTLRQQVSYVIGRNIGSDLRRNQIDLDFESLATGVRDAVADAPPKWSEAELQAAMESFQQQMQQKAAGRAQQLQQRAAVNKQQADKFLAENKAKQGVQTTPSGLQYSVLQQGTGPSPTAKDTVSCHYRGKLLDGTEFDSSYERGEPAEFPVGGVIKGWTEALLKMHVGDKWQLFVPAELAYGQNPPPGSPIEPGSLLLFEVELLGISGQ